MSRAAVFVVACLAACQPRAVVPAASPVAVQRVADASPPRSVHLAASHVAGVLALRGPSWLLDGGRLRTPTVIVVDVDVDAPASIALGDVELGFIDPHDRPVGTFHAWVARDRMTGAAATRIVPAGPLSAADGIAMVQAEGTAFDGTLPPGRTRLRFNAWIDAPVNPGFPTRYRLVLHGPTGTVAVVVGAAELPWPTG